MTKLKFLPSLLAFFLCALPALGVHAQLQAQKKSAPKTHASVTAPSPALPLATLPLLPASAVREIDHIVALVNSEPITKNEVLLRQRRLEAQWRAQGLSVPSEQELFTSVREQLIDEHILQQLAKENGVRISDSQLSEVLRGIAQQNQLATIAELKARYEADGGNWSNYQDEIRNELARAQLREREVDARVRVSDSEVDQAMQQKNSADNATPDINLAQILIALPDDPSASQIAKAKQEADSVIAQLRGGADFAQIAAKVSQSSDKEKGGVMGLRSASRYPPLFVEATKSLKAGDISALQRSAAGFHILKLLERKAGSTAMVTQSHVRHILLPLTANLTEAQAKRQLTNYKSQIDAGSTDFATIAREHSTDGSAAQGGDLGWAVPGLFVPEFERVMNALPTGKISEPFTSRFGVHLLEVVERKQAPVSVHEQRELVRSQLREKKGAEAYAPWMADARGRAFVEYKNGYQ